MRRLFRANLARLKKSRCFWNCVCFMAVYGISMVLIAFYSLCRDGYEIPLDSICFDHAPLMGFAAVVYISLFLGTEYSDGTIRNKLIVGRRRHEVYLANLAVNAAGVFAIGLAYEGAMFLLGIPLLGIHLETEIPALLLLAALTILMSLAWTAVFTLCSMLNQNKATVVSVGILSVLFLSIFSGYVQSRLKEPEMYEAPYTELTDEGAVVIWETEENPYYLEGAKREVYTFLNDFLPAGQGLQIRSRQTDRAWQMAAYSGLIMLASTGAGILMFSKKDIK